MFKKITDETPNLTPHPLRRAAILAAVGVAVEVVVMVAIYKNDKN